MKKKKLIVLIALVFAGGVLMSSCRSHQQCPGVYSDAQDNARTEQNHTS